MTPAEVAAILRQFNAWRLGDDDIEQPAPREIGEAIDAAIEMIERLEAAEKSDAESLAMYRKARDERDALRARVETTEYVADHQKARADSALRVAEGWEIKCGELRAAVRHEADCVEAAMAGIVALRAKITEMEKQEPARLVTPTAYRWRYRGAVKWQYGELTEETARVAKEHNHEVQPLYLAPGAKGE